jgi:hypothetical protein
MGLTFAENTRPFCRTCWNPSFGTALLIAVWVTGCNNNCFTFTSNPPTGTIGIRASDPSTTCALTKATSAIRVQMGTEPVCSSCAGSGHLQHIFVSIRGIEVYSSLTTDDDPADWQELTPQLANKPLQVDLVRGTSDRSVRQLLGDSVSIPPGIYHQVRLRFVPNESSTDDRLPEKNACGKVGFNCVVMADGRIWPLRLDGAAPELRITSNRIEGASLFIRPDINNDLVIELKPVWAWFSSADEGLRLLPALTGNARVRGVDFEELGTPEDGVVHDSLSRLAHN